MARYTPHYGLHQWEPEDSFLREDFNQDLARIDTALEEKAEVVIGSYTGNGYIKTIELGFRPKFVCIPSRNVYGTMLADGGTNAQLAITDTGFTVTYQSTSGIHSNEANAVYYYLALR